MKTYAERIASISPLMVENYEKIEKLRNDGKNPFRNDAMYSHSLGMFYYKYKDLSKEAIDTENSCDSEEWSFNGKVRFIRRMGKAIFLKIQNENTFTVTKPSYGEFVPTDNFLQIFVSKETVGESVFSDIDHLDIGDIISVSGVAMRTKTGELSLNAKNLHVLTKSIRSLPKVNGFADVETRYRQRYADLIVNDLSRKRLITRTKIISIIRSIFSGYEYMEVETPMLHPTLGGANARPFITHHNALDMEFYLRIAPELYLKRLLVGGFEKVFEINRNFRNEGMSTQHNPEFTMLEFYAAYKDVNYLINTIEDIFMSIANSMRYGKILFDPPEVDENGDLPKNWGLFRDPETYSLCIIVDGRKIEIPSNKNLRFNRISIIDEVQKLLGVEDRESVWSRDTLVNYCNQNNVHIPHGDEGNIIYAIFESKIEKNIQDPTFVLDYPTSVSPLARRNDKDPRIVDRFEFFIMGREIANGFSELNDPEDQYNRFAEQLNNAREHGDAEAMQMDEDYIRALEYGMPPAAGAGIGIDRLVMLFTGASSIRDVVFFPHMRKEIAEGE
jgi:lysyl-tRNA synthetase class 2